MNVRGRRGLLPPLTEAALENTEGTNESLLEAIGRVIRDARKSWKGEKSVRLPASIVPKLARLRREAFRLAEEL